MTEAYPLLTVSNVNYWYWEVEPHWSGFDIARVVECGTTTLYRFMKRNNITIRSKSEANINRYNCPSKYEKFVKIMRTPEFKARQSLVTQKAMSRPEVRKRLSESAKKANKKRLSASQKAVLFLLHSKEELFLTDFGKMIKISKIELDNKLRKLYNRGYIDRAKSRNGNCLNNYKSHYKYSLMKGNKDLFPD